LTPSPDTDDDWFDAASRAKLNPDDDIRRVLAHLRDRATDLKGEKMLVSLNAYLKASASILPDRIDQLRPFFTPPSTNLARTLRTAAYRKTQRVVRHRPPSSNHRPKSFGDIEYDQSFTFGPTGGSSGQLRGR